MWAILRLQKDRLYPEALKDDKSFINGRKNQKLSLKEMIEVEMSQTDYLLWICQC